MRKINVLTCLLAAAVLFHSCTETVRLQEPEADPVAESKLVFSPENAVDGNLLVYFSENAVEKVEKSALTKACGVMTRSGIDDFDSVLENIGAESLNRLFPVDIRNEERTRKAGLHRWYTVKFDKGTDLKEAALALASVSEVSKVEFNQKLEIASDFKVTPLSKSEMLTKAGSGRTAFNDPYLGLQWNYENVGNTDIYSGIKAGADANCVRAWDLCTGDPRVVVAVIDDAVQWDHPDLAANMWRNDREIPGNGIDDDGNGLVDDVYGFNFVTDSPLVLPEGLEASHGTHVAGTVAAVNNNGTGVSGIAGGSGNGDGARIMSCQVFWGEEGGSGGILAKAIKYAADNGAAIIQCSLGYDAGAYTSDSKYEQNESVLKEAIDYFSGTKNCDAVDGGIAIFAAGNEMSSIGAYPGAYKDYISVTAMSCDYTPAYYTNFGPGCNVAAPGGDAYQSYLENEGSGSQILSTIAGGEYGYFQGTSMACPHVSGVAALGLSYALQTGKTFTSKEFKSILLTSVNGIDQYCTGTKQYVSGGKLATLDLSAYRNKMGSGYIDAFQVLMNIRGTTCIPVSTGSQVMIDVAEYIGDGSPNLQVSTVEISAEDRSRLGITSSPTVFGGRILLTCSKPGSGIMKVTLRAGTNSDSGINGMMIEKEFALIARPGNPANGGWL